MKRNLSVAVTGRAVFDDDAMIVAATGYDRLGTVFQEEVQDGLDVTL